jgi:hypothetical protein
VVGFALILALFAQLITTGPSLLISSGLSYLLRESLDPTQIQLIQTIIQSLSGMILSLIYMPLQLTAITLLYFDLRVRTEGLDIQLQLGSEPAGPQPDWHSFLAEKAPAPENTGLVTGRELGSFALLTLAVIGIYLAFIALVLPFTMLSMSSRGF